MRMANRLVRLLSRMMDRPQRGVELGVWKGDTSQVLLDSFPECHLTLVDPWQEWSAGTTYSRSDRRMGSIPQSGWDAARAECEARFAGHPRVRILPMISSEAILQVDGQVDFVFIDADHSYEVVRQDIDLWLPRTTGVICGHDYGPHFPGVRRAVDETFGGDSGHIVNPGSRLWAVNLRTWRQSARNQEKSECP